MLCMLAPDVAHFKKRCIQFFQNQPDQLKNQLSFCVRNQLTYAPRIRIRGKDRKHEVETIFSLGIKST